MKELPQLRYGLFFPPRQFINIPIYYANVICSISKCSSGSNSTFKNKIVNPETSSIISVIKM